MVTSLISSVILVGMISVARVAAEKVVDVHLEAQGSSDANYKACGAKLTRSFAMRRSQRRAHGTIDGSRPLTLSSFLRSLLNPNGAGYDRMESTLNEREGRILKGNNATNYQTDQPFMAAIEKSGTFKCNGFVIHPRWILTWSQCYDDSLNNYVALGITSWTAKTGSVYRSTAASTTLQDFVGFFSSAVEALSVKKPVPGQWGMFYTGSSTIITGYGTATLPICLGTGFTIDGETAYFAGWGSSSKTGDGRTGTDLLRWVQMKMQSASTCNWKYYWNSKFTFSSANYRKFYSTSLEFCASPSSLAVEGPCVLDQGGPMYKAASGQQWTAIGVFHDLGRSDNKCGQATAPAIFTNLNYYVDTIVSIIKSVGTGSITASTVASAMTSLIATITAALAAAVVG